MLTVFGQDESIQKIEDTMTMSMMGLRGTSRPGGVFLLLGPTGSGKTHTVEYLTEKYHGDLKKLLKINCAEFAMEHEISRLIGAPPGYIGHGDTSAILTKKALMSGCSLECGWTFLLLDEIEKGCQSLQDILLGIMDRGELRNGKAENLSFEKVFIFLTANVGGEEFSRGQFGFESSALSLDLRIKESLRSAFRPEFINRLDCAVRFDPLPEEALRNIAKTEIVVLAERVDAQCKKLRIGFSDFSMPDPEALLTAILTQGDCKRYGAREIKRIVASEIAVPISRILKELKTTDRGKLSIAVREGGIVVCWTEKESRKLRASSGQ